jgi:hypothetical protein
MSLGIWAYYNQANFGVYCSRIGIKTPSDFGDYHIQRSNVVFRIYRELYNIEQIQSRHDIDRSSTADFGVATSHE